MSVNSKMTAIADAIRAKTGGTELLTLDDMAQDIAAIDTSENLDDVLTEQESIIDQIQAALEGKAAASVETCTISFTGGNTFYFNGTTPDGIVTGATYASGTSVTVLKNTMVVIAIQSWALGPSVTGNYIGAITSAAVSDDDNTGANWSGDAANANQFRIVGFITEDLTIYADLD